MTVLEKNISTRLAHRVFKILRGFFNARKSERYGRQSEMVKSFQLRFNSLPSSWILLQDFLVKLVRSNQMLLAENRIIKDNKFWHLGRNSINRLKTITGWKPWRKRTQDSVELRLGYLASAREEKTDLVWSEGFLEVSISSQITVCLFNDRSLKIGRNSIWILLIPSKTFRHSRQNYNTITNCKSEAVIETWIFK